MPHFAARARVALAIKPKPGIGQAGPTRPIRAFRAQEIVHLRSAKPRWIPKGPAAYRANMLLELAS